MHTIDVVCEETARCDAIEPHRCYVRRVYCRASDVGWPHSVAFQEVQAQVVPLLYRLVERVGVQRASHRKTNVGTKRFVKGNIDLLSVARITIVVPRTGSGHRGFPDGLRGLAFIGRAEAAGATHPQTTFDSGRIKPVPSRKGTVI